jgi:hypothetical protein
MQIRFIYSETDLNENTTLETRTRFSKFERPTQQTTDQVEAASSSLFVFPCKNYSLFFWQVGMVSKFKKFCVLATCTYVIISPSCCFGGFSVLFLYCQDSAKKSIYIYV